MLTLDLFAVTRTLQRLLRFNIERLHGPGLTLNITAMPPERVDSAHTLNLHLYHVVEDPATRNRGPKPTRESPLGLVLYYILTAHHEVNDVFDAETQHLLMGLAMKTLHDFPTIDDRVAFDRGDPVPETVLPPEHTGASAELAISLRPIAPEDAIDFWSAESSATVRLAAYYEVRTVFLEPEPLTTITGTVIDVGLFVEAGAPPTLTRTRSVVRFTPPAATGVGPQEIAARPARATLGHDLDPSPATIFVVGSALGSPPDARLALRTAAWRDLDPPVAVAEIDPDLNPDWGSVVAGDVARFEFRSVLRVEAPGAGIRQIAIRPGHYHVSVRKRGRAAGPAGTQRVTETESNWLDVALGPHIDDATAPDAAGRIVLLLAPTYAIDDPDILYGFAIDGVAYQRTDAFADDPATDAGLFMPVPTGIEFHPHFDTAAPGFHQVRLSADGAEGQPFWIAT